MDLFENIKIYTVSEMTKSIKSILENRFETIYIEGEISNLNTPVSGHKYFVLKDKHSQLAAVLFRHNGRKLEFKLEDGLQVICLGRITVYEPRGQYQIIVERIEPKGWGVLQLAFWQLKEKLQKEGLFKKELKKSIPFLPQKIGVVTSSTGKAFHDILNVVDRRFSNLEIILVPVRVQGKEAAEEIASGIRLFNRYKDIDVMIVGRGGGSLEDLWAFNEEVVARAIFDSQIPVISAVGHEPDVTISDMVADLRAPTPSAAAELVISRKEEIESNILNLLNKLKKIVSIRLDLMDSKVLNLTDRYFFNYPLNLLLEYQQNLDEEMKRMHNLITSLIKEKEEKFANLITRLQGLNPLCVLSRGYSITTVFATGEIVKDSKSVNKHDIIKTMLKHGEIKSEVIENDERTKI